MRRLQPIWVCLFAAGWVLLNVSCKKKCDPTAPFTDLVPSTNGPIIVGHIAHNYSAYFNKATVYVSDSTGNTGTANTNVSLVNNGVTVSLPLVSGMANTDAITIMGAPYIMGYMYSESITYTAGQAYTFLVNVDGTTYSASATAIAGDPLVEPSDGSAGVTCSWMNGVGNKNYIRVSSNGSFDATIGPPIPSNPYVVQNDVFTNETPGAGDDIVTLHVVRFAASTFPNASPSSCFIFNLVNQANY
jgi:hypothetical protein